MAFIYTCYLTICVFSDFGYFVLSVLDCIVYYCSDKAERRTVAASTCYRAKLVLVQPLRRCFSRLFAP
jgi:hypothetical protein